MEEDEQPTRPFQTVGADFFSYGGKEYLAYVDRASGWVSIVCFNKNGVTSNEMLPYIRKFFVEYGIPEKFESDGGPQFSANDFQSFLRKWGVEWRPSAPYYPQSNGLAESAVKKLKHLVAKIVDTEGRMDFDKLDRGLLEMRNTPNESGISPAKMEFGQEMRSILPSIASQLIKERRKNYYNQRSHNLDALAVNDKVRIQDDEKSVGTTKRWTRTGIIVKVGSHRQYQVELTNGYKIWRNRRFLRKAYSAEKESNGARITFAKEMPKRHPNTQEEELWEIPARRENTERISKSRNRARVDYRKLAGLD